ncbi:MAG: hypothetical protein ACRDRO_08665 [Pseudonocardiaceae bacterium]
MNSAWPWWMRMSQPVWCTAEMVGALVFALVARPVRLRLSFVQFALGALISAKVPTILLGLSSWYFVALVLWGAIGGLHTVFNINSTNLRQEIVPDRLRARVASVSSALSLAMMLAGALLGGFLATYVEVGRFYVVTGSIGMLLVAGFLVGPLRGAWRWQDDELSDQRR